VPVDKRSYGKESSSEGGIFSVPHHTIERKLFCGCGGKTFFGDNSKGEKSSEETLSVGKKGCGVWGGERRGGGTLHRHQPRQGGKKRSGGGGTMIVLRAVG